MRRSPLVTIALVGVVAAAGPARADEGVETHEKGSFGAGIIIGEPTGVSARLYLKDDQAVQAAVGSAFVGGGWQIHADYCWHPWILQERDTFTLPVYFGPGVRAIRYDDGRDSHYYALGLRAVIGMVFDFKNVPLDVFLEIAGVGEYGFKDEEGFGVSLNGGAGIRYYF
jgi:hypothetical protein